MIDLRKFLSFFSGTRLILLCILCFIPILAFRDYSPSNELRYLSIVDEALNSGRFFAFTFHGEPYADKPPLFFLGMMLCRWLSGGHYMFPYALLSMLSAIVTLMAMNSMAKIQLSENQRSNSSIVLISCGLFMAMSFMLRADMMMVMFITLAVREFFMMEFQGHTEGYRLWLFPLYIFLALFSKGLVGILLPLISIIVYLLVSRQYKRIGQYFGWRTWLVLLALAALWFCAVWLEGGRDYLYNLTVHQTVGRAVDAFHHKQPWYYYGMAIWYVLFPYSILLIADFVSMLFRWRQLKAWQQYFGVIVLSTLVFLSVSSGKLEVYLLPIFPFLVYLVMSDAGYWSAKRWSRWCIAIPSLIFVAVCPALIIYIDQSLPFQMSAIPLIIASSIVSLLGVWSLIVLFVKRRCVKAMLYQGAAVLILLLGAGLSSSYVNPQIGYGELCRDAKAVSENNRVDRYVVCGIPRSAGMDAFLGKAPDIIGFEELQSDNLHDCVVMMRASGLKQVDEQVLKEHFWGYSSNSQYAILLFLR